MENVDNLTVIGGVPRCVACNKLYKKTEANEHGLCPKCFSEKVGVTEYDSARVLDSGSENKEQENPSALLQEDMQSITSTDIRDEFARSERKNIEPQVREAKPAQVIRDCFATMVEDGKITPAILTILTDTEATKCELGIRYAFLKEFMPDAPIKELTYVGGHARYSSKPIEVNGKQYIITNDLYRKNVNKFMEWSNLFY